MLDIATLLPFSAAAVLMLATPGPVSFYIMARGIQQGRGAAFVALAGVQCGDLVHILAAAGGLSALYTSTPLLADLLRYAGAAYLLLLAVQTVRARKLMHAGVNADQRSAPSLGQVFRQSFVLNVLSPQTSLFYLAFLPAFVIAERGSLFGQFILLGCVFLLIGMLIEGAFALTAGWVGFRLRTSDRFLRTQQWVMGGIYALIAGALVVTTTG